MRPRSIKQCPKCSRIVPDVEYITNLRTINLKIKMLVLTFCTPPPAIQQQKPSSGAKKCFCLILQKLKELISSLSHMRKQVRGTSRA